MKKLEDIPKKEIFNVPDEYFEKLPSQIQNRIGEKKQSTFSFSMGLKYALPAFVLIMAIFWFYPKSTDMQNSESILASVATEDLVAYLNDSEVSTEDVIESVDFSGTDLDEIEESIYEVNDNESLENFVNEVD
jgi:hypothetical protein